MSRGLIRLLDPGKTIDYLAAFAVGTAPIVCALMIGAAYTLEYTCDDGTVRAYRGYLDAVNWWSLAFLLPALLYAFRWAFSKIAPVYQPWRPDSLPPILNLLTDEQSQQAAYERLRRSVLSRANMTVALVIVVIVHVLDMWPTVAPYVTGKAAHQDWTSMFLLQKCVPAAYEAGGLVTKNGNTALVLIAYAAQFSVVFLGTVAIILLLRHNVFFLGNVYQRRWVPEGEANRFFQMNPQDVDRCFGFRVANEAFNTQVKALMIAGLAMFLSRYAHSVGSAGKITDLFNWPPVFPKLSFPVAGQWLMAIFWLVALAIVASPGIVKLLPRVPSRGGERVQQSIGHYLREFFSDEAWPKDKDGRDEPVPVVAARFAASSFWPTGDNRAGVLFFFSYWVFFVILLPPAVHDVTYMVLSVVVFGVVAYLAKLATFGALRSSLGYIDESLVTVARIPELHDGGTGAGEKSDIGVFISYRRRDTVEYARSLHKELLRHFKEENVFRDIADIGPGENFVKKINAALDRIDAVLVLIGERWLEAADGEGKPRLHDPADMVHLEIATALRRGKRVFPVLVQGARMPGQAELPYPLEELARLNAAEISDTRWDYDVGRLIEGIKGVSQSR